MTRKPAWKNYENKSNKSGVVAGIFVLSLLFGFLAFGYVKSVHIKGRPSDNSRKSANTYLAILGTKPSALFAFQKETGKAALFTLDDAKKVPGGVGVGDLVMIGDLKKNGDGLAFINSMTLAYRAKISNYVLFKNLNESAEDVKSGFAKFTSYWTPVAILIGGVEHGNIKSINITRFSAIKLWWQLKSLRAENIKITDLTAGNSEKLTVDGQKVLGVDESFLNNNIQKFSESDDVISEHLKVIVKNPGKNRLVSQLAAGFVNNTGADLREVREEGPMVDETTIYTDEGGSKTARYLATIFDCDIKRLPESENQGTVMVVLGADFGNTYIR